jgi:hypothetical protein
VQSAKCQLWMETIGTGQAQSATIGIIIVP